ncbi:MAG TPA: glycoside hydrolase family 95 protein, partial [Puia sp.]|nr:glycoside hydrolase family 95 protein [Puia sp.]
GQIVKAVIKSTLGGNLRLRVPNELKTGTAGMHRAEGDNSNSFFQTELIPAAVISEGATITLPDLKQTFVYDLPTEPGREYIFISK